MATVSERTKQTLDALRDVFKSPSVPENMTLEEGTKFCDEKYGAIIEQALLAERRLAMDSCIETVERMRDGAQLDILAQALRAAAEKEVSK